MSGAGLSPRGVLAGRLPAAGDATPPFPADLVRLVALEYELGPETVALAWELARCVPDLEPRARRTLLALVLATLVSHQQGSTCLPLAGDGAATFDHLLTTLDGPDGPTAARALLVDPRLAPVLGGPDDYRPLVREGDRLYHQRLCHHERRLAAAVRARLARPPRTWPAGAVAAALAALLADPPRRGATPLALSPEQQDALRAAAAAPLTVVTGGPGTGKTALVVSLLRLLARLGVAPEAVALAAPTGKAAARLTESITQALDSLAGAAPPDQALRAGAAAVTLHRLLGYSPRDDRFAHHEHDRLAHEVVVVDEGSMIDLLLMERLLAAVRDDALVVILGDAEQLPSVDAGAVFRDLIPPAPAAAGDPRARAAVRLRHSFRVAAGDPAGASLLAVAAAVNAGRDAELVAPPETAPDPGRIARRAGPEALTFAGVELLAPAAAAAPGAELEPFLAHWFTRRVCPDAGLVARLRAAYPLGPDGFAPADRVALDGLFRHFEGHRLLCLTRGDAWPTGAARVNLALHELLRRRLRPGHLVRAGGDLEPGEPVLMLRNDYDRGLFNGDQGVILWVAPAGAAPLPMVVFRRGPGDFAAFSLAALRGDLERCFAMTVHKAQGSEFDHVGLILPGREMALLTRELIYTALTRSRRGVVVVGREELLRRGVTRRLERFSGVAERLRG